MKDEPTNGLPPIRVLIAEKHPATHQGLCAILAAAPDIEVVGIVEDGAAIEQQVTALRPDILLLDLIMPNAAPLAITQWVGAHYPATLVLIFTAHDWEVYLAQAIEAGAAGYLTKEHTPQQLVEAIRRAARGETLFTEEQAARAAAWDRNVGSRWRSLTQREQAVAQRIAAGEGNPQIAEALEIREHTVETHVSNILRKLGLATRLEVAVWLWKHRLVERDSPAGGNPPGKNGGFPGLTRSSAL